ncbi:hypothetical protein ACLOJK_038419, partial [Asimina triloba]
VFPLGNHLTFNQPIPRQHIHVLVLVTWKTFQHVEYSPTTIALATKENWPTVTAIVTPLTASARPQSSHRTTTASPLIASMTHRSSHKTTTTLAPAASMAS